MDNEILDNEILENDDEETGILTLTDENGVETDFEYLDCIPYEGKEYLVLLPADEAATDVVILEVEPVDEETENYLSIQDEDLLNAVYDIFKEKYKMHQYSCLSQKLHKTVIFKTTVFLSYAQDSKWATTTAWANKPKPSLHRLNLRKSQIGRAHV